MEQFRTYRNKSKKYVEIAREWVVGEKFKFPDVLAGGRHSVIDTRTGRTCRGN